MIDVKTVVTEVKTLFESAYADQWPLIKEKAEFYLDMTEVRLTELATNLATGDISPEFAIERLKEESVILQNELISFAIIIGAASENLIKDTTQIFTDLINDITK